MDSGPTTVSFKVTAPKLPTTTFSPIQLLSRVAGPDIPMFAPACISVLLPLIRTKGWIVEPVEIFSAATSRPILTELKSGIITPCSCNLRS